MNKKNKPDDKPLLTLMKSLVKFVDKDEKAVLDNAQLLNILNKEFNVDLRTAHPLELDVNTNILKKFLKQWPNWDKVEEYAQKSKKDPKIDIEAVFNKEYKSLREYLQGMLDLSKDITKENIAKLSKLDQSEDSTTNVELEVHCSRAQLNKLFFSQPNPQQGNTIFNLDPGELKIQLQQCESESLFNWPNLIFKVTIGPYKFTRTNKLHLNHTLVNLKLNNATSDPPNISKQLHTRITNRSQYRNSIKQLQAINYIRKILQNDTSFENSFLGKFLLSILKELEKGPANIDQNSEYMYFLSQHAYVRYLRSDFNFETSPANTATSTDAIDYNRFSLHLEEVIIPSVVFKLKRNSHKISPAEALKAIKKESWIKTECVDCNAHFDGLETLSSHVFNRHCNEPDVKCMNCKMEFSWGYMANNNWQHDCVVKK